MNDEPTATQISVERRGWLRHLLCLLVVLGSVLAVEPAGRAFACDMVEVWSIDIEPSELATILDPNGAWAVRARAESEEQDGGEPFHVPRFTGASKSQVVEHYPETDDWFEGAMWATQSTWGDATDQPPVYERPVRKADATDCDSGKASDLGDTRYWLEDAATGEAFEILTYRIESQSVEDDLEALFGSPTDVSNKSAGGRSEDPRTDPTIDASRRQWIEFGVAGVGVVALAMLLTRDG